MYYSFKSYWGCIYLVLAIIIPISSVLSKDEAFMFASIPVGLLLFMASVIFSYYIEISDEELIVKNLIFFWLKKRYKRKEIKIYYKTIINSDSAFRELDYDAIRIKFEDKSKKDKIVRLDYRTVNRWMDLETQLKKCKYKYDFFEFHCRYQNSIQEIENQ